MLTLPAELTRRYEALLRQQGLAREHQPYYLKWMRYYWDFCHKCGFKPRARQSFPPFDEKLRTKKQSGVQRQQARHAVALYYALVLGDRDGGQWLREKVPVDDSDNTPGDVGGANASPADAATAAPLVCSAIACKTGPRKEGKPQQSLPLEMPPNAPSPHARRPVGLPRATLEPPIQPLPQATPRDSAGSTLAGASWVWVYDNLHSAIKVRHYSTKTLQAYKAWTQKFQTFTKSKDPERVTMDDVKSAGIDSPYSWPTWPLPNEFEGFSGELRLSALFPFGARSIGITLSGSDLRNTRGLMLTGLARGVFASPATGAFTSAGLGTED